MRSLSPTLVALSLVCGCVTSYEIDPYDQIPEQPFVFPEEETFGRAEYAWIGPIPTRKGLDYPTTLPPSEIWQSRMDGHTFGFNMLVDNLSPVPANVTSTRQVSDKYSSAIVRIEGGTYAARPGEHNLAIGTTEHSKRSLRQADSGLGPINSDLQTFLLVDVQVSLEPGHIYRIGTKILDEAPITFKKPCNNPHSLYSHVRIGSVYEVSIIVYDETADKIVARRKSLEDSRGEWQVANAENCVDSYTAFIQGFPDSIYVQQARTALDRLERRAVVEMDSPKEMSVWSSDKYRWVATFRETGGISGVTLRCEKYRVGRAGGYWEYYSSWKGTVVLAPGGSASEDFWISKSDKWAGGSFTCDWSGTDDAGNIINIHQRVGIPQ